MKKKMGLDRDLSEFAIANPKPPDSRLVPSVKAGRSLFVLLSVTPGRSSHGVRQDRAEQYILQQVPSQVQEKEARKD